MGVGVGAPWDWAAHLAPFAAQLLCLWAFGVLLGWLLPRPKFVQGGLNARAVFLSSPPGLWFRRTLLAAHGVLIVREVWYRFCTPGTFRTLLRAMWASSRGRAAYGAALAAAQSPFADPALKALVEEAAAAATAVEEEEVVELDWPVTTQDLEVFKSHLDEDPGAATVPAGAGRWEKMLRKDWPACTYTAWRRSLPIGRTEYKSVTVSEDATAAEMQDFYLDDDTRPKWDGMISDHSLLEAGPGGPAARCQVVRWLRSFPFAFISQREYVIARRAFRGADGAHYGITKSASHAAAPRVDGIVRMESYYSMWRCRDVPCPRGTGRPACETTLLHFEDFGIPENLARFAVRHGMAGFAKRMIPEVLTFVEERRSRCDPHASDPHAYGMGAHPAAAALAAMRHAASAPALLVSRSLLDLDLEEEDEGLALEVARSLEDSASERYSVATSASGSAGRGSSGSGYGSMQRSPSLRRIGYMALASGMAIALAGASGGRAGGGALPPPMPPPPAPPAAAPSTTSSGGYAGSKHRRHHHGSGGKRTHHHGGRRLVTRAVQKVGHPIIPSALQQQQREEH